MLLIIGGNNMKEYLPFDLDMDDIMEEYSKETTVQAVGEGLKEGERKEIDYFYYTPPLGRKRLVTLIRKTSHHYGEYLLYCNGVPYYASNSHKLYGR